MDQRQVSLEEEHVIMHITVITNSSWGKVFSSAEEETERKAM